MPGGRLCESKTSSNQLSRARLAVPRPLEPQSLSFACREEVSRKEARIDAQCRSLINIQDAKKQLSKELQESKGELSMILAVRSQECNAVQRALKEKTWHESQKNAALEREAKLHEEHQRLQKEQCRLKACLQKAARQTTPRPTPHSQPR